MPNTKNFKSKKVNRSTRKKDAKRRITRKQVGGDEPHLKAPHMNASMMKPNKRKAPPPPVESLLIKLNQYNFSNPKLHSSINFRKLKTALHNHSNNNPENFINRIKNINNINHLRKISGLFAGRPQIQPKIIEHISEMIIKNKGNEDIKFFAKKERKYDTHRKIYEEIEKFDSSVEPTNIALKLAFHYRFTNEQTPILKRIQNNPNLSPEQKTEIEQKLEEFNKIQRVIGSSVTLDENTIENTIEKIKKQFPNTNESIITALVRNHQTYINDKTNPDDTKFYKRLYEESKKIEQQNEDDLEDKIKQLKKDENQYESVFNPFKVPSGQSANEKVADMYREYKQAEKNEQNKNEFFTKYNLTSPLAQDVFVKKLEFDYATTAPRSAIDKLISDELGQTSTKNEVLISQKNNWEKNREQLIQTIKGEKNPTQKYKLLKTLRQMNASQGINTISQPTASNNTIAKTENYKLRTHLTEANIATIKAQALAKVIGSQQNTAETTKPDTVVEESNA